MQVAPLYCWPLIVEAWPTGNTAAVALGSITVGPQIMFPGARLSDEMLWAFNTGLVTLVLMFKDGIFAPKGEIPTYSPTSSGSRSTDAAARTTVLPLPWTSQATPTRGEKALRYAL